MTTTTSRRRAIRLLAPLAVLGLVAAACGSDDDSTSSDTDTTDVAGSETTAPMPDGTEPTTDMVDGPTIQIRGQDFSEAITIAEVYGQYLEAKGYPVEILTPAGFRTEALDGIENGDFNLIVDYIGGTQTALAPDAESTADADEIVSILAEPLEAIGATLLDYSPAVDGDAFVVRGDSEASTISDVAGLDYVLGEALANNEVDAVIWNTTAPQITEQGFKVLEDDQGLFPAQNIAPIISTELLDAYGDQLAADINELSAMITTDDLLAWNTETDIEFRESDEVATEWLESKGLL